jgi:hypothetical protein
MTFLMPYSMLSKGWGRDFRGLSVFDLCTGMMIPFILVTSCVVIASSSQFHAKPGTGLLDDSVKAPAGLVGQYNKLLDARLKAEVGDTYASLGPEDKAAGVNALPDADKQMAAMLVKRDAFNLAGTLAPLMGSGFSKLVFGIGVLGMGLSTIIILMLISGFVICEVFGFPHGGKEHKWGCMLASVGVLGPFIWSGGAKFWLAVPTSTFCMLLLPIAYFTFLFMMNSKKILGSDIPKGNMRAIINILMGIACIGALTAASWSIWNKPPLFKTLGIIVAVGLIIGAIITHIIIRGRTSGEQAES